MTTLFISDLHLDPTRPAVTALFREFLADEAAHADALYVLGDLFEAWVGDDDDQPLAAEVADAFAALRARGVPVAFLHGNRDFLIGADYAARCGFRLLPEESVETIEGVPTLLLHGDTLCTDDVAYQAFRRQSRDPRWQAQLLAQPLPVRRALAAQARAESAKHMAGAAAEIMDVNAEAVRAAFERHGVARMIHGHTHRPKIHALEAGGRDAQRIVLGDWYEQGSVLRVTPDAIVLDAL